MIPFFAGLSLLCAGTLMYEVVLTRLLSVTSWYYMAFVSISMAMFGMTAGALFVQLLPRYFSRDRVPLRLAQAALLSAVSLPVGLVAMLAVPLDLSASLQTLCSFLMFSTIIATPFFFSGMAVCLSLTRTPFPIGRVYFTDLLGAALGCLASAVILNLIDAPSALFFVSALLFASAAGYASYAQEKRLAGFSTVGMFALLVVCVLNSSTLYGIQPIWSKGHIDTRMRILSEQWNSISRVRAYKPQTGAPTMWGPSPIMPHITADEIPLNIDNDASTSITRFQGDLAALKYFRYDVTATGPQLRPGGSAAVIGVGGGRDVLNCAVNGFHRIVGIEVNSAMVRLTSRQLDWFSGFSKIPGFELVNDEGRSYLTRSGEKFDLIQASLVDTWAATSAGAMTLSENALYTVDGWKVFYEHLLPGGIITFSRWYGGPSKEVFRLYSVARAAMIAEGVADPDRQIVLITGGSIATMLATNKPFTGADLAKIRAIADEMQFKLLLFPGETPATPELKFISATHTLDQLAALRDKDLVDYSPVFDTSPYFFNAVHLRNIREFIRIGGSGGNLLAILFVCCFLFAALVLVISTIVVPAWLMMKSAPGTSPAIGGILYFLAIGLGFMLIEMGMMQQLSVFLGHPIYSLVVVLTGLVFSTGIGSMVSDRLPLSSSWQSRVPALAVAVLIVLYRLAVVPVIHMFVAGVLWQRAAVALALVFPCGFCLGFCFPIGMRWMTRLGGEASLPWMWALNGAAGTLGSFVAIVLSMETSIATCVLTGAGLYLFAALAMPAKPRKASLEIPSEVEQVQAA